MPLVFPKHAQRREDVDQGVNYWINYPDPDVPELFAARAEIRPGQGHDFHRHPGRAELIYVLAGTVEQWIGSDCSTLRAGDAVLIPANEVHASFNAGPDTVVLLVALSPADCDAPLGEDMSAQAPWNTLRATNPRHK